MHPALPLAHQFLSQHTATLTELLRHRGELNYGLQLAEMLKQVISHATESITEKQIEAIVLLTKQTLDGLDNNLAHYMREQEKFNDQYRATTDLLLRAEITRHITNIDHQMKAIRRDRETLHRFSTQIIAICVDAGLKFVRDLSVSYTELRKID